MFTLQEEHF